MRRLAHQPQRLLNAPFRKEAEKRRLLQLHRHTLPQCDVKYRVAGGVGEVGQNDRILS